MSSYETCRECDSETGRAGASEDSLYHSYVGPFCEDCYDDWPDKIEAELAKVRREFRDFRAGQAVSVPKQWRDTMEELAADLESEIENRRSGDLDRRIERDLIVVREARALLAEALVGKNTEEGT